MNISVRLEGGLGDHLLANRFVYAIKQKYKDSKIYAYSDTNGKIFQKECLEFLYPSLYEKIIVINNKKNNNFIEQNRLGIEQFNSSYNNIPEDIKKEIENYDKFYDLHIDSLKWLDYDFDWYRYFYFLPEPDPILKENIKDKYIVMHLLSEDSGAHRLQNDYIDNFLSKISQQFPIKVITTKNSKDQFKKYNNVEYIIDDIKNICKLIANASCMFSIDSGFAHVAKCFTIPVVTQSFFCNKAGESSPPFKIRWIIDQTHVYPMHYNIDYTIQILSKLYNHKKYSLVNSILSDNIFWERY